MNFEMQSVDVKDLFTAAAKMQSELGHAIKDGHNPHFNNDFATLESCIDASRKILTENGLCVLQSMASVDSKTVLITTLGHTSGQFIRSVTPILFAKGTAQDMGSGTTYARRFAYAAIIGLTQTDDDGNLASEQPRARQPDQKQQLKNHAPKSNPQQTSPGDYVVNIPKSKIHGKRLSEINKSEIETSLNYWIQRAERDGVTLGGEAAKFVKMAQQYLGGDT